MRRWWTTLATCLALSACGGVRAPRAEESGSGPSLAVTAADPAALAEAAVEGDAGTRARAIDALRELGPRGLSALASRYEGSLDDPARAPLAARIREAFDAVAAQRDAYESRLYWYTDLAQATRVARAEHKPILMLRLLGRLDEELSCANSRFFRTVLYPDARVHDELTQRFVLVWTSERPVPKLTIDFGDGRHLTRTITGNSVHYVLDANGRAFDAIPGLVAAGPFVAALERVRQSAARASDLDDADFANARRAWHADELARSTEALQRLCATARIDCSALSGSLARVTPREEQGSVLQPGAGSAVPIAAAKAVIERPVLQRMGFEVPPDTVDATNLGRLVDAIAPQTVLAPESQRIVRAKLEGVPDPSTGAPVRRFAGEIEARLVVFQRALAEDTLRNEDLHRTLNRWVTLDRVGTTFDDLNARIYADMFYTPRSDPWLGLMPEGYAGLTSEGVVGALP